VSDDAEQHPFDSSDTSSFADGGPLDAQEGSARVGELLPC
jgi:hypothetical protein